MLYYAILHWYSDPRPPLGATASGYLGLVLLGAVLIAVGHFLSSLTENQIVAAFVGFGILLTVWLVAGLGALLGNTTMGHIVSYISFMEHTIAW